MPPFTRNPTEAYTVLHLTCGFLDRAVHLTCCSGWHKSSARSWQHVYFRSIALGVPSLLHSQHTHGFSCDLHYCSTESLNAHALGIAQDWQNPRGNGSQCCSGLVNSLRAWRAVRNHSPLHSDKIWAAIGRQRVYFCESGLASGKGSMTQT